MRRVVASPLGAEDADGMGAGWAVPDGKNESPEQT
jgi:hypothetical protein